MQATSPRFSTLSSLVINSTGAETPANLNIRSQEGSHYFPPSTNQLDDNGNTPLHLAAKALDDNGNTPLHLAAKANDIASVKDLINKGDDPSFKNSKGYTAYNIANLNGSKECSEILKKASHQPVVHNYYKSFFYPHTVEQIIDILNTCNEENVERTINNNWIYVDTVDHSGNTPLLSACKSGHTEMVKLLIASGANVNTKFDFTDAPINLAAGNGYVEIVKLLTAAGANVNAEFNYTEAPINLAARNGHIEVIDLLLNAGVDINLKKGENLCYPPLFYATRSGHTETMKFLIKKGADVNATIYYDNFTDTPLLSACASGHIEAVKILLAAGADVTAKGYQTPLEVATNCKFNEITELIENYISILEENERIIDNLTAFSLSKPNGSNLSEFRGTVVHSNYTFGKHVVIDGLLSEEYKDLIRYII